MAEQTLVPIAGSELPSLRSCRTIGKLARKRIIPITIHVRHRRELPRDLHRLLLHQQDHLSYDEFHERHGMDAEHGDLVMKFAAENNLTVTGHHAAACMIDLEGTVAACNRAFGIKLRHYSASGREFFGHKRPISVPEYRDGIVETVTGLDNRSGLVRIRPEAATPRDLPDEIPSGWQTYFASEIARLYNFPAALDGSGETIALFSLGGRVNETDIRDYFELQQLPVPQVDIVNIGGDCGDGEPVIDDMELTLDLQVAGSVAPGAKLVVFRINPDLDHPWLAALKHAIFHPEHRPSIISISYGSAEGLYREQELHVVNQTLAAAARMGITVCAASGDGGSATRDYDHFPPASHVNFPACCPYVLAVGGTTLHVDSQGHLHEEAWNHLNQCHLATGGGVSRVFARPDYQESITIPPHSSGGDFCGRGVPDVAANASITTGIKVVFQGKLTSSGGTSASTPLWAGLIARLNQGLGRRLGHIHPALYALAGSGVLHDIPQGFNGAYRACCGWDPCTGLGRPDGTLLLHALSTMVHPDLADSPAALTALVARASHAAEVSDRAARHAASVWEHVSPN